MRIHYLQHVPFEGLASIQSWSDIAGHTVSHTKLYDKNPFPKIDDFDFLIVMGGPMGVYETDQYGWLKEEKIFIEQALRHNKKVLGICLGAQLIADVLGARVYKNKEKEIGWMDISFTESAKTHKAFQKFPSSLNVFHWHGDTFDLPSGALHIAKSDACFNQAFTYKDNVVALQFHMEVTEIAIKDLLLNCKEELIDAPYIQTEEKILEGLPRCHSMNQWMSKLLHNL